MITCHLKYQIDPYQIPAFENYSRLWVGIVNRMGGTHHGYFLPAEGANSIAFSAFRAFRITSAIAKNQRLIQNALAHSHWHKRSDSSSAPREPSCGQCSIDPKPSPTGFLAANHME